MTVFKQTLLLVFFSSALAYGSSKFDSTTMKALEASSSVDVLLILEQGSTQSSILIIEPKAKKRHVFKVLADKAHKSQRPVVKLLQQMKLQYESFYLLNAVAVFGVSQNQLVELASLQQVKKVIANNPVQILPKPQVQTAEKETTLSAVGPNIVATGATAVWEKYKTKGEGIVVAGQDTGVDWTHPALTSKYRGYTQQGTLHDYSWHDAIKQPIAGGNGNNPCGYNTTAPCDDGQHGTHTLGTIVGSTSEITVGMAPNAQWIACRNMDKGYGTPSTYLSCFEFFMAPYPQNGNKLTDARPDLAPHVINNSWGCPISEGCNGEEMNAVLEALWNAGIMVIASAGNDGPRCSTINAPPANNSDYTFSVGAYNHRDGRIANFSSRGPSTLDGKIGPDIVAPGVSINSTVPGGRYSATFWSGTSMSGPHVVGAVALLWSAKPELIGDLQRTSELLRKGADPTTTAEACGGTPGAEVPNNTFGWGKLNILKSIELAQ